MFDINQCLDFFNNANVRDMLKLFIFFISGVFFIFPKLANGEDINSFLLKADPSRGMAQFSRCSACHTIDQGDRHKVGPNLYGIIGKRAGSNQSYNKYSSPLLDSNVFWDYESLDKYLENSKKFIPRNKMACGGIKDIQDRADLIIFMRHYHDNPPPLEAE